MGEARRSVASVLKAGDVVYVEAVADQPGTWKLRQPPEIQGALVAMDPYTGRVLAMVGGFSFAESEFNRATQALAAAGLLVQAVRLRGGARQRLHAVLGGPRRADRDPRRRRGLAAGELRRQVLRARRRCGPASRSRATS